jgi:hypothetical protein
MRAQNDAYPTENFAGRPTSAHSTNKQISHRRPIGSQCYDEGSELGPPRLKLSIHHVWLPKATA